MLAPIAAVFVKLALPDVAPITGCCEGVVVLAPTTAVFAKLVLPDAAPITGCCEGIPGMVGFWAPTDCAVGEDPKVSGEAVADFADEVIPKPLNADVVALVVVASPAEAVEDVKGF